jgi:hypothetical protein
MDINHIYVLLWSNPQWGKYKLVLEIGSLLPKVVSKSVQLLIVPLNYKLS